MKKIAFKIFYIFAAVVVMLNLVLTVYDSLAFSIEDIPTGKFNVPIKYGVTHSFPKAGEYEISFKRTDGAAITVTGVTFYNGKTEVVKLTSEPFILKLDRAYAGKLTHMVISGTSGGESSGKIEIRRNVLKPRKEAK